MIVNLPVTDYMEAPLLLLGWIVSNALWSVLMTTCLAIIPFIAILMSEWSRASREGDDEGNKGQVLQYRLINAVGGMLMCYVFVAYPMMGVSIQPESSIVRTNNDGSSCTVAMIGQGQWSNTTLNSMSGSTAEIPLWWAAVHVVSKGLTNAAVSAIPCTPDWQAIATEVDLQSIKDPILKREVGEFSEACYGASRYKLFHTTGSLTEAQAKDTDWIGSNYFLTTSGYYDSFYAPRPIIGFPYSATRDNARTNTGPGRPGYPTCKEWWSTSSVGLKDRLYNSVDPSLWNYIQTVSGITDAVEESVIRRMISPRSGGANGNKLDIVRGYGDLDSTGVAESASSLVGGFGAMLTDAVGKVGMDMVKQALPMVQYLLVMAIVIGLPIVLVISGYSLSVVGTATFALFGTWFLTFWWELARWMSSNLLSMLYGGIYGEGSTNMVLTVVSTTLNPYDSMVIVFVEWAMFFILPGIWMGMLSWVGFKAGAAITTALSDGSQSAQKAGNEGAGVAKKTLTKK